MSSLQSLGPSLAFSLAVAYNGYAKGSLSGDGALLAAVFAIITLVACPTKVFATALLVFFFAGSRATKYKHALKARLEESDAGPAAPGSVKAGAGNRDWKQVACNGLFGVAACSAWIYRFGSTISNNYSATASQVCPIAVGDVEVQRSSNTLVFAAVGFWSACLGDTLASELGILSRSRPRLVTTFKRVVPGTNGGVSAWGTLMSLVGGLVVSAAAVAVLVAENQTCRSAAWAASPDDAYAFRSLLLVGAGAGVFGSWLDSVLGALFQETLFSKKRGMVVHSRSTNPSENKDIISVGGRNLLSNNAVNLLASVATGLASGYIGYTSL